MVNVNSENFMAEVIEKSKTMPVLVDFWAESCGPCKVLGPILEKLESEYQNVFALVKINTEEDQNLAAQFKIQSIPAVKLFKDEKLIDEFTGALPEEQIRSFLDKHVESSASKELMQLYNEEEFDKVLNEIRQLKEPSDKQLTLAWNCIIAKIKKITTIDQFDEQDLKLIPAHGHRLSTSKEAIENFLKSKPASDDFKNFTLAFSKNSQRDATEYFLQKMESASSEEKEKHKKSLFAVFAILGQSHEVTIEARKKLSSLLF